MPRINLLPHREQERKRRRREFGVAAIAAFLAGAVVAGGAKVVYSSWIDAQNEKNNLLKKEIVKLDAEIADIQDLENRKQRLVARMEIIEKLQRKRPEIVHQFDELVHTVPDGVYLTSIKQNGNKLELKGVAQSSTRVSTFMRNIDSSVWMDNPQLDVVETAKDSSTGGSNFTVFANTVGVNLDAGGETTEEGCKMNLLEELKSLDPRDPGRWPLVVRGFFVLLVFVICAALFSYMFVWNEDRPVLQKAQADELDLRTQFENKQQRAANLDAYKAQLTDMERTFGAMLRQLPGKTEVPNLLVDISQTGLAAGLTEKLFQPSPEKSNGFYAELPIKIRLVGSYHQFGAFVSGIAALPRIVTLHDIQIVPVSDKGSYDNLTMDVTAKTYRYIEDEGAKAAPKKKTGGAT